MKQCLVSAMLGIGLLESTQATNRYVSLTGGNIPPYTNWDNAAATIQDAISACSSGDVVWVTNGVYETGGAINWSSWSQTNRVAITTAYVTVRSANNDPVHTIIKGAYDPNGSNGTNGPASVRCVYMTNYTWLIGFTLTNGSGASPSGTGGGILCLNTTPQISNCVIICNVAAPPNGYAGGVYYGTLYNCKVAYNSTVWEGGGTKYSILSNCTVIGNSAGWRSGGTSYGTLYNCTMIGNYNAGSAGGTLYNCTMISNIYYGASGCTLSNCTAIGTVSGRGFDGCTVYNSTSISNASGGAINSTLYNCILTGNRSDNNAGGSGVSGCTAYNCLIAGNDAYSVSAGRYGCGAGNSTLYNCTVVGNAARGTVKGGGIIGGTSINSIVYFNTAVAGGSNWDSSVVSVFSNSCTAPATTIWAAGNTTADPALDWGSDYGTNHVAGTYRLSPLSPCINGGINQSWMTNIADTRSKDLDVQRRIQYGTVDMGAYERFNKGAVFTFR